MKFNISGREIQEEKLITEGGYGYVWRAYDTQTREIFALKRMICQGKERTQVAQQEMQIMRNLPVHQNIVRFYGGEIITIQDGVMAIFLMELCEGGSLFDLMQKHMENRFKELQLVYIVQQACEGLRALHSMNPPLTHRDIKIENILIKNKMFKLCDFGSCSSQQVDFSQVPKSKHHDYEEVFEKYTTLMYRPPEMCDLFAGYQVNTKVDVWMLGCVLFTLCFFVHPFVDGQKLAIVTGSYKIPENSTFNEKMHDLIRSMLTPNPKFRPSINDILNICNNWDSIQKIQLNQQAQEIKNIFLNQKREIESFTKNVKPIKKFDGDIPIEELMKIQAKIKEEEENPSFHQQQKQQDILQAKKRLLAQQQQQKEKEEKAKQFQVNKKQISTDEWTDFSQAPNQNNQNNLSSFNQPQQQWTSWDQPQNKNNNSNIGQQQLWDQPQYNQNIQIPSQADQNQQDEWFDFQWAQKSNNNNNNNNQNNNSFNTNNFQNQKLQQQQFQVQQNQVNNQNVAVQQQIQENPQQQIKSQKTFWDVQQQQQQLTPQNQFQQQPIQNNYNNNNQQQPIKSEKNLQQISDDLIGLGDSQPMPKKPDLMDLNDIQF